MENQDTAKILATSRVKLAAAATLMMILAGSAAEYVRQGRTLDEAVVVMMKPQAETVAAAVVEKAEPAKAAEVVGVENAEELRRNSEGAAEFIRYVQDIHERAEAVVKPESALSKIIPQQVLQTAPVPEVPVNEQVIEVYDENGEVVEIVEVRGETTAEPQAAEVDEAPVEGGVMEGTAVEPAVNEPESEPTNSGQESEPVVENVPAPEAMPAESAQDEHVAPELVVNTQENNQEIIETEADAPAIDMMKDIIAREQAAAGENNVLN